MAMIKFDNVEKYYGKFHALKNINLEFEKGEVVVVIGPSGSGKSTFLRCLNHIEIPTDGEVFVEGKKLNIKNKKELLSFKKTKEEMKKFIESDSLEFLSLKDMKQCLNNSSICTGCFNGGYADY